MHRHMLKKLRFRPCVTKSPIWRRFEKKTLHQFWWKCLCLKKIELCRQSSNECRNEFWMIHVLWWTLECMQKFHFLWECMRLFWMKMYLWMQWSSICHKYSFVWYWHLERSSQLHRKCMRFTLFIFLFSTLMLTFEVNCSLWYHWIHLKFALKKVIVKIVASLAVPFETS